MELFAIFGRILLRDDGVENKLTGITEKAHETDSKISKLGENLSNLGQGIANVGQSLLTHLTLPFAAAAGAVVKLAEKSSDLNEAQNVIENTFKSSAKAIEDWTNTTANSAGISKTASSQWVGFMGAMLKSSGIAEKAAGDMSKNLVQLTGDMSSFYNIGTSDMWDKIRSGISGETEPLKQLGINMSVANLEAYAMSQGIAKAYKNMSQAEQTTLRYNYLLSVTKDAQGDFGRTLNDSFANQARVAKLNLETLTTTLGSKFLPSVQESTKGLNEYLVALNKAMNGENQSAKLGSSINSLANAISKITPEQIGNIASIGTALASLGPGMLIFGKVTQAVGKFQIGIENSIQSIAEFGLKSKDGFQKAAKGANTFMKSSAKIPTFLRTLSNDSKICFGIMNSVASEKLGALGNIIKTKLLPIGNFASKTFSKLPVGMQVAFDKMGMVLTQTLPEITSKLTGAFGVMGGKVFSGLKAIVGISLKMIAPAALIGVLLIGLGVAEQQMGARLNKIIADITKKGPQLIKNFTAGLLSRIPDLISAGTALLDSLIKALIANAPELIKAAVAIISSLINGVTINLPLLIPVVLQLIQTIIIAIVDNLPQIIKAGLNLLIALVQGISNNIDKIVETIVKVVEEIIKVLIENLPLIIEAGIKILVALIEGLSKAIPKLIEALPEIVHAIWNGLKEVDWGSLGKAIIDGIGEGIKAAAEGLWGVIKGVAKGAIGIAKELLGIHSPSRVFRDEVGKWIPEGIAVGIEENGDIVNSKLSDLSKNLHFDTNIGAKLNHNFGVAGNIKNTASSAEVPANTKTINQYITINSNKPLNPSEIIRKQKQASKELALEWGL